MVLIFWGTFGNIHWSSESFHHERILLFTVLQRIPLFHFEPNEKILAKLHPCIDLELMSSK